MNKPTKKTKPRAKPAVTFGEKIEHPPKGSPAATADERETPLFRPHDEFGEWLLRNA